jgi:hypothetical protein
LKGRIDGADAAAAAWPIHNANAIAQDICRKRQRYTLPPSHRDTARQMHDLLGKNYWHQRDYSQNIINIASLNAIQQNKLNSGDNTIRCSQHHRIQEYY